LPSEEDDATESIRRRRRRDSRASRFFVESAKSETARKRETRGARYVSDEMTRRRGNPHTTWTRRRRNTVDSGAYVRFPFIFSPTSVVYVRKEKRY
jgi:hypothetical protein